MGFGLATCGFLALATRAFGRWSWPGFHHLAQTLIPVAGCGVFLGLSALTVRLLRQEGLSLDWVDTARLILLGAASAWSLWLGARVSRSYARSLSVAGLATLTLGGAIAVSAAGPVFMFWIW